MSDTSLPAYGSTATGEGLDGRSYTGTVVAVLDSLRLVVVDSGWRNVAIEPAGIDTPGGAE